MIIKWRGIVFLFKNKRNVKKKREKGANHNHAEGEKALSGNKKGKELAQSEIITNTYKSQVIPEQNIKKHVIQKANEMEEEMGK